jgi:hypothetical protein
VQRLVFTLGVHVNGLGLGLGFAEAITGVPLAVAACTAGEAAFAGTAVAPTTTSRRTAAPTQRATPRSILFTAGSSMAALTGAYPRGDTPGKRAVA